MVAENETALVEQEPVGHNQSYSNNHYDEEIVFDKKIELTAEGLIPFYERLLRYQTLRSLGFG